MNYDIVNIYDIKIKIHEFIKNLSNNTIIEIFKQNDIKNVTKTMYRIHDRKFLIEKLESIIKTFIWIDFIDNVKFSILKEEFNFINKKSNQNKTKIKKFILKSEIINKDIEEYIINLSDEYKNELFQIYEINKNYNEKIILLLNKIYFIGLKYFLNQLNTEVKELLYKEYLFNQNNININIILYKILQINIINDNNNKQLITINTEKVINTNDEIINFNNNIFTEKFFEDWYDTYFILNKNERKIMFNQNDEKFEKMFLKTNANKNFISRKRKFCEIIEYIDKNIPLDLDSINNLKDCHCSNCINNVKEIIRYKKRKYLLKTIL